MVDEENWQLEAAAKWSRMPISRGKKDGRLVAAGMPRRVWKCVMVMCVIEEEKRKETRETSP